ncbi:MAG: DUF2934 domain-containing protein [Gallionellaceae bacterium]|nr:DUF2934 domain-containing protein [Gallionellaceae bacterium]
MAISQSISSKTTSRTATAIAAKKPLAKKARATPATIKKPAVKTTPAATKPAVKTPSAKKRLPKAATAASNKMQITAEERYKMIAAAAYLRAEKRGFHGGDALSDWVAAEAEIDARL